ncbi:hypothetical protein [Kineococcus sp. SYSU DK004]|uniref:hypothetical protein n=1 Tax=Kineococcus sp. SYSU DK004 TaxID=3383125 RepID=UPI003D7C7A96
MHRNGSGISIMSVLAAEAYADRRTPLPAPKPAPAAPVAEVAPVAAPVAVAEAAPRKRSWSLVGLARRAAA